jgi:2-dehydropantoate 2-reductase
MDAITIIGAGAIGCAVGHALRSAGTAVTFIDSNPGKVQWGRTHGVCIEGRSAIPATFQLFDEWRPNPDHITLLCTKCYDNAAVLSRLPANAFLVPIQNGFDSELDARNHPFEGIASFVSECVPGQTQIRITRKGSLHFGARHPGAGGPNLKTHVRIRELVAALERHAPFRVVWATEILPYKYTKLMYNAAIGPLAAAAGLDNGQLLSVPLARRQFFELLRENYAILRGAGIPLARIGLFHPNTVQRILRTRWVANALAWAFYPSLRGSYCSMFGDLPAGRTEIDYYIGHLLELAGDRPCPLNRRVYELVKRMEAARIPPRRELLKSLLVEPALSLG